MPAAYQCTKMAKPSSRSDCIWTSLIRTSCITKSRLMTTRSLAHGRCSRPCIVQITTYDHALTRPWTVLKTMHRERNPIFVEAVCAEDNLQVNIGNEHYMLNSARELMPARKDQAPPDLKHFNQPKN